MVLRTDGCSCHGRWTSSRKIQMTTYFVSGHLDITPDEFAEHYMARLIRANAAGASFVVGDAPGCDTIAQQFLRDQDITVFHMFTSPRNNPAGLPTRGGFTSDEERDRAMTAASDDDIAWVRPGRENSGTARNLIRRTHAGN